MSAIATIPRSKRFRIGQRMAVAVAAVALLGITYQITRPPELVWWRSPPLGENKVILRLLVPEGWRGQLTPLVSSPRYRLIYWSLEPAEIRPRILRDLFPAGEKQASVFVGIEWQAKPKGMDRGVTTVASDGGLKQATRGIELRHGQSAFVNYHRTNEAAFNRTYKKICNSLTIE